MRSGRAVGAIVVALPLLLATTLPASGATRSGPKPEIQHGRPANAVPVAAENSVYADNLRIIASSASDLVYAETVAAPLTFARPTKPTVFVRESGRPKPRKLRHPVQASANLTIVGNLATAAIPGHKVRWWNLTSAEAGRAGKAVKAGTTGTTGTIRVPKPFHYLTTSKGGVLEQRASGAIVDRPIHGHHTARLGKPLGTYTAYKTGEISSSNGAGIVLPRRHGLVYISWARQTHARTLDSSGANRIACTSLYRGDAACIGSEGGTDNAVLRVPINGNRAFKRVVQRANPCYVAITARQTGWVSCATAELHTIPAKGGKAATAQGIGRSLWSAFGTFVYPARSILIRHAPTYAPQIDTTSSAHSGRRAIINGSSSRALTYSLSLTTGRVGYVDDSSLSALVRSRSVAGHSKLTVGASTIVGAAGVPDGAGVVVSGPSTAAQLPQPGGTTLRITSPFSTATPDGAQSAQISGNRAIIWSSSKSTGGGVRSLLDLTTGAITPLPRLRHAVIAGDTIAYFKADGSIWTQNIATNAAPVMIRPADPRPARPALSTLFAYGDEVGWSLRDANDSYLGAGYTSQADPSDVHTLPATARLVGLSDDGAVVSAATASRGVRYRLYPYGDGGSMTIFAAKSPTITSFSVADRRMAWVDHNGEGYVAPLPIALPQPLPRYLGDPAARTTFDRSTDPKWRAVLPTTEALSTCSVVITQAANPITTLPCTTSAAKRGDAIATWDGTDRFGAQVPAGTFTWTLDATNSAGPVLDATGGTTPVTGTIAVS